MWQGALKKTKVKLDLLTDIAINAKKSTRGGICPTIYRYEKANNYMNLSLLRILVNLMKIL